MFPRVTWTWPRLRWRRSYQISMLWRILSHGGTPVTIGFNTKSLSLMTWIMTGGTPMTKRTPPCYRGFPIQFEKWSHHCSYFWRSFFGIPVWCVTLAKTWCTMWGAVFHFPGICKCYVNFVIEHYVNHFQQSCFAQSQYHFRSFNEHLESFRNVQFIYHATQHVRWLRKSTANPLSSGSSMNRTCFVAILGRFILPEKNGIQPAGIRISSANDGYFE